MKEQSKDDNNHDIDRELSKVGSVHSKISDFVWYGFGLVAVIGIIWLNFSSYFSDKSEDQSNAINQQEEYHIISTAMEPALPAKLAGIAPAAGKEEAGTIDPMLAQYQLRMEELERQKSLAAHKLADARKRSPMLIYSKGASSTSSGANFSADMFASKQGRSAGFGNSRSDGANGFYDGNSKSHVETVRAGRLANQSQMIAQGTTIRGILESAIQSDIAGYIRAVVSEDIYSFDGSQVLIPRGSKIIGRYQSGIKRSQSRLLVVWQRIIMPSGIDIMIDAPGTDHLGRAGLGGNVDTHFIQRFGAAILLSMIDGAIQAGVNAADNSNAQTVITQSGNGLARSSEIALENSINIAPTIHVDQGTPINIFVTKDLDFSASRVQKQKSSWWR